MFGEGGIEVLIRVVKSCFYSFLEISLFFQFFEGFRDMVIFFLLYSSCFVDVFGYVVSVLGNENSGFSFFFFYGRCRFVSVYLGLFQVEGLVRGFLFFQLFFGLRFVQLVRFQGRFWRLIGSFFVKEFAKISRLLLLQLRFFLCAQNKILIF